MTLLPSLLFRGTRMRLACCFSLGFFLCSSALRADFELKDEPGKQLDVLRDGKLVARFIYVADRSSTERRQETYKPFLHVYDPEGDAPITKGPGGSFTHHRGIFIGWNKIRCGGKSYDRWHMKGGEQVHQRFVEKVAGKQSARFVSEIRWSGETPESALVMENRSTTFLPGPAPGQLLIDVASTLTAGAEAIALDGDPEHAGLHFRPADEVDRRATLYVFPIESADPRKDRDYRWVGETFLLNQKRFSVVLLHHPSNPAGARFSAYRDYGRFGVFWSTEIEAGSSKQFRSRFLVCAGEMPETELIQHAWNDYAGMNEPTPKRTVRPVK